MGTSERKLCKLCHGLARRAFGTHKILGMPAYEFYIKAFIWERFNKASRSELSTEEWEEVCSWLRQILLIRAMFAEKQTKFHKGGRK